MNRPNRANMPMVQGSSLAQEMKANHNRQISQPPISSIHSIYTSNQLLNQGIDGITVSQVEGLKMSHKEYDSLLNKQFSSGPYGQQLPPYGAKTGALRKGSRAQAIRPGTQKPNEIGRLNDYLHC